jgi:hypothetical protein
VACGVGEVGLEVTEPGGARVLDSWVGPGFGPRPEQAVRAKRSAATSSVIARAAAVVMVAPSVLCNLKDTVVTCAVTSVPSVRAR